MTYPKVASAAAFANAGGVFQWAENAQKLGFGGGAGSAQTDALGGLAAPEMQIVGLSRLTGPVSGDPKAPIAAALGSVVKNEFTPADFFRGSKLLGGIDLAAVIQVAAAAGLDAAPQFHSSQRGTDIVTNFDWVTELKSGPLFIANADHRAAAASRCTGRSSLRETTSQPQRDRRLRP